MCEKGLSNLNGNFTTYVLFLINKPNDPKKNGMMPFKRQFGFIFTEGMPENKFAQSCAHELGHGVFTLRHTFSPKADYVIAEGQTDNLMDYSDGKTLHKWQWDRVHNPRKITITGGSEEEVAQDVIGDEYKLFSILKTIGTNSLVLGVQCTKQAEVKDGMTLLLNDSYYHVFFMEYEFNNDGVNISPVKISTSEINYDKNSIPKNLNLDAIFKNNFIFLRKNNITPLKCINLSEDYSEVCKTNSFKNVKNLYIKLANDVAKCLNDDIASILQQLKTQIRGNQEIEFTQYGHVFKLNDKNEMERVENPISEADIIGGNWKEGKEMKMRIGYDKDGIVQFKAIGIKKDLKIVEDERGQKIASLEEISKKILANSNAFLKAYKVKSFETTINTSELNSFSNNSQEGFERRNYNVKDNTRVAKNYLLEQDNSINIAQETFPDGKKIELDKDATIIKLLSEGGGICVSFLKTGNVEKEVYLEKTESVITASGIATGTIEAVGGQVTDITSIVTSIHDVIFDKEARKKMVSSFNEIKEVVADDPISLFPILKDIALETFTGAGTNEYDEMKKDGTDTGRKQHLITKTSVTTVTTLLTFTAIFYNDLLKVTKDLSQKMNAKVVARKAMKAYAGAEVLTNFADALTNINFKNLTERPIEEIQKLSLETWGFDRACIEQFVVMIPAMLEMIGDEMEFSEISINMQTSKLPTPLVNSIIGEYANCFPLNFKWQEVPLFYRFTFAFNCRDYTNGKPFLDCFSIRNILLSAGASSISTAFITEKRMRSLAKENIPTNENGNDMKNNSKTVVANLNTAAFIDFRWVSKWKEEVSGIEPLLLNRIDDVFNIPTLFVEGALTVNLTLPILKGWINYVQPYGIWVSSGQFYAGTRVGFNTEKITKEAISINKGRWKAFKESIKNSRSLESTKHDIENISSAIIPFILWLNF